MWVLESPLVVKELILDFFLEAKKMNIESISQNEILTFLGVPKKNIDRKNNPVYDIRGISKTDIQNETLLLVNQANNT